MLGQSTGSQASGAQHSTALATPRDPLGLLGAQRALHQKHRLVFDNGESMPNNADAVLPLTRGPVFRGMLRRGFSLPITQARTPQMQPSAGETPSERRFSLPAIQ